MQLLKADTLTKVVIGPVVAVGDGFTPVTTLSLSTADEAELLKHDAASVTDISGNTFAAITSADGYYNLTLTAAQLDTEGRLTVVINDDDLCLPVRADFMVVAANVFDSLYAASGTDVLDVNATQIGGQTASASGAVTFPSTIASAAALATAQADLDILTGSDGVTLATVQPNYAPNTVVPDAAGTVPTDGSLTVTLADSVTHGGTAAKLRLGSSDSTPAFYVTSSGGVAVQYQTTGGGAGAWLVQGPAMIAAAKFASGAGAPVWDIAPSHQIEAVIQQVNGFSTTAKGQINAECDTALSDYDPPTRTDATADKDAILTRLGTPADTDVSTDIANVQTVVDAGATPADVNNQMLDVLQTDTPIFGHSVFDSLKRIEVTAGNATLTGAGTGTEVLTSEDASLTATFTVDGSGNISAIVWA